MLDVKLFLEDRIVIALLRLLLAGAGDQNQLQQDVANLKIDFKRREIRLTKMLSSASQKTQLERELGQVFEAVLLQVDRGCKFSVTIAPCAVREHTKSNIYTQHARESDECTVKV